MIKFYALAKPFKLNPSFLPPLFSNHRNMYLHIIEHFLHKQLELFSNFLILRSQKLPPKIKNCHREQKIATKGGVFATF